LTDTVYARTVAWEHPAWQLVHKLLTQHEPCQRLGPPHLRHDFPVSSEQPLHDALAAVRCRQQRKGHLQASSGGKKMRKCTSATSACRPAVGGRSTLVPNFARCTCSYAAGQQCNQRLPCPVSPCAFHQGLVVVAAQHTPTAARFGVCPAVYCVLRAVYCVVCTTQCVVCTTAGKT
jgi:hypothetical protein